MRATYFKPASSALYGILAKEFDAMNDHKLFDILFYLSHAQKTKGAVLELGCGTGRITIPIAASKKKITGVDYTLPMLKLAKKKAIELALKPEWIHKDVLQLDLKKKFSLIIAPFGFLHHFSTKQEIEQLLKMVKKHLRPEGLFVLDILHPQKVSCLAKDYERDQRLGRIPLNWYSGSKPKEAYYFYPEEMREILQQNGFRIKKEYGCFTGRKLDANSHAYIAVTSKAKK